MSYFFFWLAFKTICAKYEKLLFSISRIQALDTKKVSSKTYIPFFYDHERKKENNLYVFNYELPKNNEVNDIYGE